MTHFYSENFFDELKSFVKKKKERLEARVKRTSIIVILLGAGNKAIERRRTICRKLVNEGIICLIPEDDFPSDVAPSLVEEAFLKSSDVDLIFINVESWGSTTEFTQFYLDRAVAPKLRILVYHKYHPLYGRSKSYLTDVYLTYMTLYGHVYAYGNNTDDSHFPSPGEIIIKLTTRYRWLKGISKI
ncbi:MAG: hypothetical protein ACTSU6_01575 [Candidatus Njordarchaeales archaeon]